MKKLTQQQILAKCRLTHGDKYDYSRTVYINRRTKMNIMCPNHGMFQQNPSAHFDQAQGCPKCSSVKHSKRQKGILKKSHKQHIQDFIITHGDTYDYSEINMGDIHSKINIICSKHGVFSQLAHAHKAGQGCPRCSVRKYHKCNNNVIYLLSGIFNGEKIYKVGVTSKRRGNRRIVQIRCESGVDNIEVVVFKGVDNALKLEAEILDLGSKVYGLRKFGGYTEFRYYSDTELSTIYEILS